MYDSNLISLWDRYKADINKLQHVLELSKRIKLFKLIKSDLDELTQDIEEDAPHHINISCNEYYCLKIRQKINEIFTAVASNRDFYKNNIVKCKKNKNGHAEITEELIDEYKAVQGEYRQLLENTINKENKFYINFSTFLRNKLLHSETQLTFGSFLTPLDNKFHCEIILDYHYIFNGFKEKYPLQESLIQKYFIDEVSKVLQMWAENEDIYRDKKRTRTFMFTFCNKLRQLGVSAKDMSEIKEQLLSDYELVKKYHNDLNFHLVSYTTVSRFQPDYLMQGHFMFNLSLILNEIYNNYLEFYVKTYEIVLSFHENDIAALIELEDKLIVNEDLPINLYYNRAKFGLNIDYSSTLCENV